MHNAWEHPILETLQHFIGGGAKKKNWLGRSTFTLALSVIGIFQE
jgi:hypothetical protein